MTQARQLSLITFIFVFATCIAIAQEPSLAEQAAAARANSAPAQQAASAVMGHTVAGDYYNEVLGFQIHHIHGLTSMSRGTMNVDEALGREALGFQAGINQAANRAFGMHDEEGNNVVVTILPVPAGTATDPTTLKSGVAKLLKKQVPTAEIGDESVLLGGTAHKFAGIRGTYTLANQEIFQSLQFVFINGYAVSITATANSEGQLQSLLAQLRNAMRWVDAPTQ